MMNSPFRGTFRVSQTYKGASHKGLDLVGVTSNEIYSTTSGVVEIAGNNDPKGFGIYVRIRDGKNVYYYGHMKATKVKVGDKVNAGCLIGIMGSTGNSTGPHCHYEMRVNANSNDFVNISTLSRIPNAIGSYEMPYLKYRVKALGNDKYYPWVHDYNICDSNGYAGVSGKQIDGLQMSYTGGNIEYRVHLLGGKWLPWVLNYDNTTINGYAGIYGQVIDAIEIKPIAGKTVILRSSVSGKDYYPWVENNSTYAGSIGKGIDRVQASVF